ncbi:hypothetical protein ACHAXT_004678 [Thalassiosira profunda]
MAAKSGKDMGISGAPLIAPAKSLVVHFTKRDLILYALGIGCCSGDDDDRDSRELQYAYENHPNFQPFPTFLLALAFTAEEQRKGQPSVGILPFPPESMVNYLEDGSSCGILPKQFFKREEDAREAGTFPILHMSQSLEMHAEMELCGKTDDDEPTQMQLRVRVTSVKPRSIGTFVTTETTYHQDGRHIATTQMVALILGLDPDAVVQWKERIDEQKRKTSTKRTELEDTDNCQEKTVIHYRIPKTAALTYRLSGDYNPIHVEDILDRSKERKVHAKNAPILHGLCTLGYAPVYVGDLLRVETWNDGPSNEGPSSAGFRVYRMDNKERSDLVVDKGRVQFRLKRLGSQTMDAAICRL